MPDDTLSRIKSDLEKVFDDILSKAFGHRRRHHRLLKRLSRLTEREKQILVLTCRGLTNREIASEMFLSIHTIRSYSRRMCLKLDLPSKAAIRIALLEAALSYREKEDPE